jgi:hypothetical protein
MVISEKDAAKLSFPALRLLERREEPEVFLPAFP